MQNIASHATQGITLPLPKKTHAHIIYMFKQQMYLLKKCLNVRVDTFYLFFY